MRLSFLTAAFYKIHYHLHHSSLPAPGASRPGAACLRGRACSSKDALKLLVELHEVHGAPGRIARPQLLYLALLYLSAAAFIFLYALQVITGRTTAVGHFMQLSARSRDVAVLDRRHLVKPEIEP